MQSIPIFIGSFFETLAILITGFILVNMRVKKNLFMIVSLSVYGGIFLVLLKESIPSYMYLVIGFLTLSLILTVFTKMNFINSLIAIISGGICLMLSELIVISSLIYFFDVELPDTGTERLLISFPYISSTLLIAFVLNKIKFRIVNVSHSKNIYLFPQSVLAILFSTIFLFYFIGLRPDNSHFLTLLSPFILLGTTLSIFVFMNRIVKQQVSTTTNKINNTYELEVIDLFRMVKSQRHDFIHHLIAVNGMLDNDKFEECKNYISNISSDVENINEVLPIFSPAIAGLLLSYKQQASLKNIIIEMHISDNLENIPCTVIETNLILGNLIKNAIEHIGTLENLEKSYINISIWRDCEDIFIEVTNPGYLGEEEITKIFEYGYSSKGKSENEGSGLAMLQKLVESYKGVIYPQMRENLVSLIVIIPSVKK